MENNVGRSEGDVDLVLSNGDMWYKEDDDKEEKDENNEDDDKKDDDKVWRRQKKTMINKMIE